MVKQNHSSALVARFDKFWQDPHQRGPLLFSLGLHLTFIIALLLPTDLFTLQHRLPEIYTVNLIDLPQPTLEPQPTKTASTPPPSLPKTKASPQVISSTPLLSSRVMPTLPSEIKIIRPRASKKIMRHKRDSRSILAAYARIKAQEAVTKELASAQAQAETEKQKALEMMAQAILTRQGPSPPSTPPLTTTDPTASSNTGQPGAGVTTNNALRIYKAAVNQQISSQWILPEGQQWQPTLQAVVIVKINKDGIVLSQDFVKRSGNTQFDKFVSQALEKASPLPRLPTELADKDYALRLTFFPRGLQ